MNEQPESLRLADELEKDRWHISGVTAQQSADELRRLHEEVERLKEDRETLISAVDTWHGEVKRLRGVLKTDGEQQAAHIRGLHESWKAEREMLVAECEFRRAEIEKLPLERDVFEERAERLTADLEALRARVFVRR